MKILVSKVSVYEIEVRLERLDGRMSNEFPGFVRALTEALPSLMKHKCIFGREGGFIQELSKGTDFAHTLEHIILELQHLADPEQLIYSGWTRPKRDAHGNPLPGLYAIHYETRDPLTGHLAALFAMQMIKDLIQNDSVNLEVILDRLRNPGTLLRGYSENAIIMAAREGFGNLLGLNDVRAGLVDLIQRSDPLVHILHDRTRGTVILWILEGEEMVAVKVLEGRHALRVSVPVGKRASLPYGACGQVFMAYLPEEAVGRLLNRPGPASLPCDLCKKQQATLHGQRKDLASYQEQLSRVRQQGYAISDEADLKGVRAIAAPIRNGQGEILAVLEANLPAIHVPAERLPEAGKLVARIAGALSCHLDASFMDLQELEGAVGVDFDSAFEGEGAGG